MGETYERCRRGDFHSYDYKAIDRAVVKCLIVNSMYKKGRYFIMKCLPFKPLYAYSNPFLYTAPQSSIDLMTGRIDSPKSLRAYSTRGGTSG